MWSLGAIFSDGGAAGIGASYVLGKHVEAVADLEYSRLAFLPTNRVRYSAPGGSGSVSADRAASLTSLDMAARARYSFGRTLPISVYAVAGAGAARVSYDLLVNRGLPTPGSGP